MRRMSRIVFSRVNVLVFSLLLALSAGGSESLAREGWRSWFERSAPTAEGIAIGDLPREARATLSLIRNGGPFPHRKDGVVFGNREKLLPLQRRGYYTEYTVPTPGVRSRGARRIVAGGDPQTSGEYYYTEDHYQSFLKIRE